MSGTDKPKPTARKGITLSWFFLFFVLFAVAGFLSPAAALLLLCGLIPGFVAILTDTDPRQTLGMAVVPMNLAGLIPFCLQLWHDRHPYTALFTLITTPWIWLVIYLAAALGWLLHYAIPPLVLMVMEWGVTQKRSTLESERNRLKQEWDGAFDQSDLES